MKYILKAKFKQPLFTKNIRFIGLAIVRRPVAFIAMVVMVVIMVIMVMSMVERVCVGSCIERLCTSLTNVMIMVGVWNRVNIIMVMMVVAQMYVQMIPMRNKMGVEESRCWFCISLANVVRAIVRNRVDVVVMVVMTKVNVIMITMWYQVRM